MARKKLNKILAWALSATIAVSPVNFAWASEAADMFSDNSENVGTVEDEQNEEELDSFTEQNPAEVFSAGDGSDDSDSSGSRKIFKNVGSFSVKNGEGFIFAPEEEATYCISTDNEEDSITVWNPALPESSVSTGNFYTIKTAPGNSYEIYICDESEEARPDINFKIEKVLDIKGISVDETWLNNNAIYPEEKVIISEINPYLPIKVTLSDGSQVTGEYLSGVDRYGMVGVVYEDSVGNLMWDEQSGNLHCPRPTQTGTYKYHFFCLADPSIISKSYTVELKPFNELFNNTATTTGESSFDISVDSDKYVTTIERCNRLYNYAFKFTPDKTATYCTEFEGAINIKNINDNRDVYNEWKESLHYFNLKAGNTYYVVLRAEEPLDNENSKLELCLLPLEKLKNIYEECSNLTSEKYEEDSWNHFSEILSEVKAFLQNAETGEINPDQIGEYLTLLLEARDNLQERESDETAPEISGITDGGSYCEGVSFKVTDDVKLDSVTVNDQEVQPGADDSYVIQGTEEEKPYTIIARDTFGNTTTYEITIGHDYYHNEPEFKWELVPNENLGEVVGITLIPKYNAKAVFSCTRDPQHTKDMACTVTESDILGTNGSYSLYYQASVNVGEQQYTGTKLIKLIDPKNPIKNPDMNNSILTGTVSENDGPQAAVKGLDEELVVSTLKQNQKDAYENKNIKTTINVILNSKGINDSVSEEDKKLAEQKMTSVMKENIFEKIEDSSINYFDLSLTGLFIQEDSESQNKSIQEYTLNNLKKKIMVELELSEKEKQVKPGLKRNFFVIHIHDNKAECLPAERIGDKLGVWTSTFSTYAIAYVDMKDNTPAPEPSYPSYPSYPVTDVTLSQTNADMAKEGETLQLTATVTPSYADNRNITWKSSDEKVAVVDKDGKVTAIANGTVVITATSADGKHSASATITVKIAPEKLILTADKKELTKLGESLQIIAKVEPDKAYDKLIWKSSNEKTATVDADGKVTATGKGEAVITATTEDGRLSEAVIVTVKIPDNSDIKVRTGYGCLKARSLSQTDNSIKVEWNSVSGADGYIIYGNRCNGNGKVYKYKKLVTITNGKIKTWTNTGLKKATYYKYIVKAYKLVDGKKVITDISTSIHAVTSGGNYGVAKAVSVTKIGNKKNTAKVTVKKGRTVQITAAEVKKDKKIKHHRALCYESSNTKVVTVTSKGVISAVGKGSCTIWVYAQNGVYKEITVTVM